MWGQKWPGQMARMKHVPNPETLTDVTNVSRADGLRSSTPRGAFPSASRPERGSGGDVCKSSINQKRSDSIGQQQGQHRSLQAPGSSHVTSTGQLTEPETDARGHSSRRGSGCGHFVPCDLGRQCGGSTGTEEIQSLQQLSHGVLDAASCWDLPSVQQQQQQHRSDQHHLQDGGCLLSSSIPGNDKHPVSIISDEAHPVNIISDEAGACVPQQQQPENSNTTPSCMVWEEPRPSQHPQHHQQHHHQQQQQQRQQQWEEPCLTQIAAGNSVGATGPSLIQVSSPLVSTPYLNWAPSELLHQDDPKWKLHVDLVVMQHVVKREREMLPIPSQPG